MIIVTYGSLAEFKQMIDGLGVRGDFLSVRIGEREYHQGHTGGRTIAHYAVLQFRLGDEIHLCKFAGPKYDFWGKEFSDHQDQRTAALDWSKRAISTIEVFCAKEGYAVVSGFWWVKDLLEISGTTLVEKEDFYVASILKEGDVEEME